MNTVKNKPIAYLDLASKTVALADGVVIKAAISISYQPVPLYMHREWVGLTDAEVLEIGKELAKTLVYRKNPNIDFDYARAISNKLKEKNSNE